MAKALDIHIAVPEAISEDGVKVAEARAKEAAVMALQQAGDLTIREAAAELSLSYEGYLQLLHQKGLPVSSFEQDPAVLDDLRRRLES
jgi:hypothetical protein